VDVTRHRKRINYQDKKTAEAGATPNEVVYRFALDVEEAIKV